jgi:hypothetical protein
LLEQIMILLEEKVTCCYHPHWLTYRKRADRHHTSPLEEVPRRVELRH